MRVLVGASLNRRPPASVEHTPRRPKMRPGCVRERCHPDIAGPSVAGCSATRPLAPPQPLRQWLYNVLYDPTRHRRYLYNYVSPYAKDAADTVARLGPGVPEWAYARMIRAECLGPACPSGSGSCRV